MASSPWTPELKQALRDLWAVRPEISTREIGLRLGVSKNAIVSQRRTLGLPERDSGLTITRKRKEARDAKLPEVERMMREGRNVMDIAKECKLNKRFLYTHRLQLGLVPIKKPTAPRVVSIKEPKAVPAMATINTPTQATISFFEPRKIQPTIQRERFQCQFLQGDEKPWTPCREQAMDGKPYCRAHHSLCYVSGSSYKRVA
jgi:hypothetical protein